MRGLVWIHNLQDFILRGVVLSVIIFLALTGNFSGGSGGSILALITFLVWVGEMVEIPLLTIRTRKPQFSIETVRVIGGMLRYPLEEEILRGNPRVYRTSITINLSALFLLILAVGVFNPDLTIEHLIVIVVTWIAVVTGSEIQPGIGIKTPVYLFLFPLVFSFLISPDNVSGLSISSGVVGILLGQITMLFSIGDGDGSRILSLGGFPSRDVYLALFVSSLIAGWMG